MFDIKQHRPVAKITIFEHHCEDCERTYSLPNQLKTCPNCENKLILDGNWWFLAKYTNMQHIDKMSKEGKSDEDLLTDIVLDFGDLEADGEPIAVDVMELHRNYPDLTQLMLGYAQQRGLFGLPDLGDFKKKLKTQQNGSHGTKKTRSDLQTVAAASKDTSK